MNLIGTLNPDEFMLSSLLVSSEQEHWYHELERSPLSKWYLSTADQEERSNPQPNMVFTSDLTGSTSAGALEFLTKPGR